MKKSKTRPKQTIKLRKRIEEFLQKNPSAIKKIPTKDIRNLFEDLQIYQVELEKYNNELRKIHKQLREGEEKYRRLFSTVSDVVMVFDAETKEFIDVNDAVSDFYGYTKEEFLELKHTDITAEPEKSDESIRQTIAGEISSIPIRYHKHKDGTMLPVEISTGAFKLGNRQMVCGVVRDITERKQAEEALRESVKRYRAVVESQTEMICRFFPDGTLTFVNEAYCRYFDKGCEELIGHKFMPFIPESDRDKVFKNIASLNQNTPVITHEHRVLAPNGGICWQKWTNRAIFDDKSNLVEYQAVGWDITDRVRVEEALWESKEKYRFLSEGTFEAVVWHDKGKIIEANEQYYEMFGYKPEELAEKDAILLTATPDSIKFMREQISLGNLGPYEVTGVKKDGTQFPMEIRAKSMKYKGKMARMAAIRDLTYRKQLEEALRESVEKYRNLVEDSVDGIAIVQGIEIKFVNLALVKMFGYRNEKEIVGHKFSEFVSPEYRNQMEQIEYDRKEGKDVPSRYQFKALRKDGTAFDAELFVNLVKYQGRVARQGIIRDISKEKQREEVMRNSEARLEALSEASFEAIFLSEKGVCLDQNQTAERMFGYTREEAIGKHGTEWIVPEDREQVKNNMVSGYEKPYEVNALRKDGTTFPCEIQARMIDYQGRSIRVTALRDITDRKRAEESLIESENNFRELAENVNDGILIAIDDGAHIFANKRASEITGYTNSELLSTTIEDLAHADEYKRIIERYKRIISGKPFQRQYETMIINKDGKEVPIEVSSAKTVWQGKPADIVSMRDIKERKEMERALQEAHDELEHRVEQRTIELAEKSRNLEELNAALKILLDKREEDKAELEERILSNVKTLIEPYLGKLKKIGFDQSQKILINILESNLNEIISPFSRRLSSKYLNLSPSEIQVANLVRQGKTNKEIAEILHVTSRTIAFHRENIRKKLGLTNQKANLKTYLMSID